MTTTITNLPTCRRCHGSGQEPAGPRYSTEQLALLDRLAELGERRSELYRKRAYMSASGRPGYDRVLAEIRQELAGDLATTIRVSDLAQALRVSDAAYYKILNGETGS